MRHSTAYLLVIVIVIACTTCDSYRRPADGGDRTMAASALTRRYAQSALAQWELRSRAAGMDCSVLLVETSIIMEDSIVEALHYGAGAYDIYRGGVQQFSRDRAFRGVVYKDRSGRMWIFGSVNPADSLAPCR